MRCAVLGCENNSKNTQNKIPKLSFYPFPQTDPELCQKWVDFCRQPKSFGLKKARICGVHFRDKDKIRNLKYEMGFQIAYVPELVPGTVPKIFTPSNEIPNNSNTNEIVASFPTVDLEEYSQSLVDAEEVRDPDTDPLNADEEQKKSKETPLKGMLAIIYPLDATAESQNNALEQNKESASPVEASPNKDLLKVIAQLKKENTKLKKNENLYKKIISDMANKLNQSNYEKENLEQKLKTIFTSNQIRYLKTGKRLIWSAEDIARTLKLYKISPAAYRLLKSQNYPLPSQKTIQVWNQISRQETDYTEEDEEQNLSTECISPSVDGQKSTEIDFSQIVLSDQDMNEFLTFRESTTNCNLNVEKTKNCSTNLILEDHSYFLAAD